MDPKEVLISAARAVEDAGLPTDLRVVGFGKAFDMIASELQPQASALKEPNGVRSVREGSGSEGIIDRMSRVLQLPIEMITSVFYIDNDEPVLSVSTKMLPKSKRAQVQDIALLVTAGRFAAGLADFTSVSQIRAVAENFNSIDSNFAANVNQLDDMLVFRGKDKNREVQLRKTGLEASINLIINYGGGNVERIA